MSDAIKYAIFTVYYLFILFFRFLIHCPNNVITIIFLFQNCCDHTITKIIKRIEDQTCISTYGQSCMILGNRGTMLFIHTIDGILKFFDVIFQKTKIFKIISKIFGKSYLGNFPSHLMTFHTEILNRKIVLRLFSLILLVHKTTVSYRKFNLETNYMLSLSQS